MLWYIHLSEENRLVSTTRKNQKGPGIQVLDPTYCTYTYLKRMQQGPIQHCTQCIVVYDGALVKSVVGITRQDRRRAPPRPRPCIPGAGIRESAMDGAGRPLLVHRGEGIRESVNGSR